MPEFIPCFTKSLPAKDLQAAAANAIKINPANAPRLDNKAMSMLSAAADITPPEFLLLVTQKYWGPSGVRLTVGFLDSPTASLRRRIIEHMNAWGSSANVEFVETGTDADVRIARQDRGLDRGYWSYLGTDIRSVPAGRATMNLQGFTDQTREEEFTRVVRHETGHTLGFDHEHLRRELVDRIDPDKAYAYFAQPPNRWTREQVDRNVLTPIDESATMSTEHADQNSVMCYQLPGDITVDGLPIIGGDDIDEADAAFAALLYPPQEFAPVGKPGARAAAPITLEEFLAIAARASRVALNPQPLPPKGKIFVGVVVSAE